MAMFVGEWLGLSLWVSYRAMHIAMAKGYGDGHVVGV